MITACLTLKSIIVSVPLLILGSVADAAITFAETAQETARRIKAWSVRQ